jgi:hypothetical protein
VKKMSGQQAWERKAKTSSSRKLQPSDYVFLSNARAGIELPFTASMTKRERTRQQRESLSLLLNRIEDAPW